jgi:superfamily II DNA helicase RecQ
MLKILTIKFENNLESFNDSILSDFLSNKEIIRWESRFFDHKNEHYWSVMVEYKSVLPPGKITIGKKGSIKNEEYKELLSENDWPLFNRLREWRAEKGKKDGVPPYIIFKNIQLAKIAVTRPVSLNALQQIEFLPAMKLDREIREIHEKK